MTGQKYWYWIPTLDSKIDVFGPRGISNDAKLSRECGIFSTWYNEDGKDKKISFTLRHDKTHEIKNATDKEPASYHFWIDSEGADGLYLTIESNGLLCIECKRGNADDNLITALLYEISSVYYEESYLNVYEDDDDPTRLMVQVVCNIDRDRAINLIYDRYVDVLLSSVSSFQSISRSDRLGALKIEYFILYARSFVDKYCSEIRDEGERLYYLSKNSQDMVSILNRTRQEHVDKERTDRVKSIDKISVSLLIMSILVAFVAGSMFNDVFPDDIKEQANIGLGLIILIVTLIIVMVCRVDYKFWKRR